MRLCCRRHFGSFAKKKKPHKNNTHDEFLPSIMTDDILHVFNRKFRRHQMLLDASFGDGGHSIKLTKSSADNTIIGLDWDYTIADRMARYLKQKTRDTKRFHFVRSKWSSMFANIQRKLPEISETISSPSAMFDGILLETGPSLQHENDKTRGLWFHTKDADFDLRYNTFLNHTFAMHEILQHPDFTAEFLADILCVFGDQDRTLSECIAHGLMNKQQQKALLTMEDFVTAMSEILAEQATQTQTEYVNPLFLFHKKKASFIRQTHPIKTTLNALIRFVNNKFIELSMALRQSELLLKPNGILMLIVYDEFESRVIAEFLESRKLLNLSTAPNDATDVFYVDLDNDDEVIDTTFVIANVTAYLKNKNEVLADREWHGLGAARFNDYNAVPFIQPHISEMSSHPKGKYARVLVLQRTGVESIENVDEFMNHGHEAHIRYLTRSHLSDAVQARIECSRKLLSYPTHNCFD